MRLWQTFRMKIFFKWVGFLLFLSLVNIGTFIYTSYIDFNIFINENSITTGEWEYLADIKSWYTRFLIAGLGFISILSLAFLIKTVRVVKRVFQNKEDVNVWKYFTRVSIILLLFASIPFYFLASMKLQISKQIERIAYTLDSEIRAYAVSSNLHLFEEDWDEENYLWKRKEYLLAEPKKLSEETDTFEEYINQYPPESNLHPPRSRPKVTPIQFHYSPAEENYLCKATVDPLHYGIRKAKTRYGIYTKDKTHHSLKILIPSDSILIFDGDGGGWTRPINGRDHNIQSRSPRESYETAGYSGGSYDTKWASRKGEISFKDNKVTFTENSYEIETGCWNRFECPNAVIGYNQNFEMNCKQITSEEMFKEEFKSLSKESTSA